MYMHGEVQTHFPVCVCSLSSFLTGSHFSLTLRYHHVEGTRYTYYLDVYTAPIDRDLFTVHPVLWYGFESPYDSAFSGGLFRYGAFLSHPPATPAVRGRFLMSGLPYYKVCVSFDCFSSRFPGFIARPFRGAGEGFEEPHLRLMV